MSVAWISLNLWVKLLILLIPIGIAVYEIYEARQKRRVKYTLLSLTIIFAVLSVLSTLSDDKKAGEADAAQKERDAIQAKYNEEISRNVQQIGGTLGSDEIARRYRETVGIISQSNAEKTAGPTVDSFFSGTDERAKAKAEMEAVANKLVNLHKVRIDPVIDYIIGSFDVWIAGIEKRGLNVEVTRTEPTTVTTNSPESSVARQMKFHNGLLALRLEVYPTQVRDGVLANNANCRILVRTSSTITEFNIFYIGEKEYAVMNSRPERFLSYKEYRGSAENPISDKRLIESLDAAIREAMTLAVDEALTPR